MNIKDYRKQAGLTQQEMSEKLEIPKRTIESWETGKRNPPKYVENLVIEKLIKIAEEKE